MNKNTITLCMIVKDEEERLGRCLESVKKLVDEIVIVDTGSTDATVEIARRYHAKLFSFQWIDDFSAARNYSIEQANGEYILILDADEYLEEHGDLYRDVETKQDYYMVSIKNYLTDGSVFSQQAIRMFRRDTGLRYYGKAHEHLNVNRVDQQLSSGVAMSVIHHDGYLHEVMDEKQKNERNFKLILKEVEENPSPYAVYNLGKVHMGYKQYEEAIKAFQRSYELDSSKGYVIPLFIHMLECYKALGNYEEGISLGQTLIKKFPQNIDFYYLLGQLYEAYGYEKDAEDVYRRCVTTKRSAMYQFKLEGTEGYLSYFKLAKIYERNNRLSEAFEEAFHAIKDNRHYVPGVKLYVEIMQRANISIEETFDHLCSVYSFTSLEDVKVLLAVLYELRHPVLARYLSLNQELGKEAKLAIVAKQYSGQYEEACNLWKNIEKLEAEMDIDLILLSILTKDMALLSKLRELLQNRDQEFSVIESMVKGLDIGTENFTPWIDELLLKICKYLIILNEFEVFEYVSGLVLGCTRETQFKLAILLEQYGFSDTAVELLMELLENQPQNQEVMALLGDIFLRKNMLDEAFVFYENLIELNREYASFARMYDYYEKLGNDRGMRKMKDQMKTTYPLSLWAQQNI